MEKMTWSKNVFKLVSPIDGRCSAHCAFALVSIPPIKAGPALPDVQLNMRIRSGLVLCRT